jgi:hypothetical protein
MPTLILKKGSQELFYPDKKRPEAEGRKVSQK